MGSPVDLGDADHLTSTPAPALEHLGTSTDVGVLEAQVSIRRQPGHELGPHILPQIARRVSAALSAASSPLAP